MAQRQKRFLLSLALFFLLFSSQAVEGASPDYNNSKKALSSSFRGVLDGMGSVGKGLWDMTTNTGKMLWHGTREGLTKGAKGARKTDSWLKKHLW